MNVVLDTNIYISALLFPGGACDQVLRVARLDSVHVFVSPDILTEFKRVMTDKFELSEEEAIDAVDRILAVAALTYPRFRIDEIKKPDADNRILECAVEAKAHFIVTGDKKHILPLKKFKGIHIVTPSEFLDIVERSF